MRGQFKNTVMELAPGDDSIVLILGDVSVYLFKDFSEQYEDRFYNMGICENTLVSVGAGLAARGLTPFVHTIAPFVTERSFEQIKLDMCYNRLGVNIVSCGATFDYAWDGATHHAYTDPKRKWTSWFGNVITTGIPPIFDFPIIHTTSTSLLNLVKELRLQTKKHH